MQKFSILIVIVYLMMLLSGCGARQHVYAETTELNSTIDSNAETEYDNSTSFDATTSATNITTSTISKSNETQNNSVVSKINNVKKEDNKLADTAATTETTAIQSGSKTYNVNVKSDCKYGTLNIISIRINYDVNNIAFYYNMSSNTELCPNMETKCIDSNNNKLQFAGFSTSNPKYTYSDTSATITKFDYTNQWIGFGGIKDFSALSTVKLTYGLDGIDPVTVTINIPGV